MIRARCARFAGPLAVVVALGLAPGAIRAQADRLADAYEKSVRDVNEAHLRKPGDTTEDALAQRGARERQRALDALLRLEASEAVDAALLRCGEAALDLALGDDFARIRTQLVTHGATQREQLGTALVRPRFVLRGLGGLDDDYLQRFADVFDAILTGYDEVFGFDEWSKVPGKKLRVRVHLVEQVTAPPHFAPEFPWHSEIDFPVIDPNELTSPTADGKFLFYGLCHELGHVIAMWGDRDREEDHHAWAHYTGCAIVDHLAATHGDAEWMKPSRDGRWRSPRIERERLADSTPGTGDRDAVLKLLLDLHDAVGPRAIGTALNWQDAKDRRLRINRVRYDSFGELREGFERTLRDRAGLARVRALLP
ncbi:MAG: hypothetical protein IPM29_10185 [Planctomycetes bacterium]|nr:hypothetical protein [Planctomycetota bacterium]